MSNESDSLNGKVSGLLKSQSRSTACENGDKPLLKFGSPTPQKTLTSQQKVQLNRLANKLFNDKEYSKAKQIYLMTNYSAGLAQMGDYYAEQKDLVEAWKMYSLAHRTDKSEPLTKKIASILSQLLGVKNG